MSVKEKTKFHILSTILPNISVTMACDLSIIIVNYNIRHFLEYCLLSVRKATAALSVQVIVVDNASTDDDYNWLPQKFPEIVFIKNENNLGFGKANNQGLQLANGKYVLFLNPDTLVPENALNDCLLFFQEKDDCGALGVHMMDGKGHFLPESKRSVPTPMISFYKFSGLEKLFPKSPIFGQYALGYWDENKVWNVPILAGAFLMARRSLLEKVGGFDEAFFMYGEDIDLSFRLQHNTGFKNYFLGPVKILHFKGESSKQNTLYYNKIFNEAMHVFVQKYHRKTNAFLMSSSIRLGTKLREWAFKLKGKRIKDKSRTIGQVKDFCFMGDEHSQAVLTEKIKRQYPTIQLSNTAAGSNNIIFCIGQNYGFQNAFQDIQKLPKTKDLYWFATDAAAIIGSNKKDETGVIWNL